VSQLYPLAFLSPRPPLLMRPVGACITRAPRIQRKRATWPLGAELNMLRWFITSFLHLIFPSFSTPPLQGFNMFNVAFNKAIVVGLSIFPISLLLMLGYAVSFLALTLISRNIALITLVLWLLIFTFVAIFNNYYEKELIKKVSEKISQNFERYINILLQRKGWLPA